MILRPLILVLGLLLSGCIIFDQKSEAVVFHHFSSPGAPAQAVPAGTQVYVPRAIIPASLRRPNIVLIDDNGWVLIEDAHRWVAPLDRAIPEAVARHLTARTGTVTTTQTPSEDHLVLLLTVDKMEVFAPAGSERSLFSLTGASEKAAVASLRMTCRLEKADGMLVAVKTLSQSSTLKERTPGAFVQAQSANLAALSGELAEWLRPALHPSK
jgi:uncharacterized lipoprotein YmbA